MNITRHNYEEFFILYLDNELSSDDRRQVERFVNENPDLKNEFELLLQTRMTPDNELVFDGKQLLLKTGLPGPISETNFEEWLLLYIDNELTVQEKIAVEEFVAGNPSAASVLQQFQKTKLHPEHSVIFPNKEILYRREKRAPVVAIRFWRIAVAASLLLAISTTAFLVFRDNNRTDEKIISEQGPATNSTKNDSSDILPNDAGVAGTEISKNDEASKNEMDPSDNIVTYKEKNSIAENEKNMQHFTSTRQDEKLIAENKITIPPTNNPSSSANNLNTTNDAQESLNTSADTHQKEALTINNDNKPIVDVTPDNTSSLHDEKTAVTIEPDYALVTDESGKKNKLRGFFRKVTRTFEKRTNIKATDDEDRLLLAGLSIKL